MGVRFNNLSHISVCAQAEMSPDSYFNDVMKSDAFFSRSSPEK